jgi:hypothetical protein
MLPNGTTFTAALLELGHVERSPFAMSLDNSATSSYATSSISGPENDVETEVESIAIAQQISKQAPATSVVPKGKGQAAGKAAAVEGLPNGQGGNDGFEGTYGDVVVSFEMPEGDEAGHRCLGIPAISKRDVQVCPRFTPQ